MSSKVKKKILKLKESSTLVINEKSKELISRGKKVYQFGFGQSPFPVPEKIVEALKNNAHRKEYLPIQGLPKLRENISKYSLNLDVNSKFLKNKMIEVDTKLTYEDKTKNKKKTRFEMTYATVVKIEEENPNKELEDLEQLGVGKQSSVCEDNHGVKLAKT